MLLPSQRQQKQWPLSCNRRNARIVRHAVNVVHVVVTATIVVIAQIVASVRIVVRLVGNARKVKATVQPLKPRRSQRQRCSRQCRSMRQSARPYVNRHLRPPTCLRLCLRPRRHQSRLRRLRLKSNARHRSHLPTRFRAMQGFSSWRQSRLRLWPTSPMNPSSAVARGHHVRRFQPNRCRWWKRATPLRNHRHSRKSPSSGWLTPA